MHQHLRRLDDVLKTMNERSTASQEDGQRGGRRSGRRRPKAPEVQPTSNRGARSGAYNILTSQDIDRVHSAALDVLERVGFSEAPDSTRDYLRGAGCTETETGRILFPRAVVEDALARANRSLVLHGQKPEHDVLLEDSRTYFSTGSASFVVVDPQNRTTRPTTLRDIFDFARMADALEHIHLFHRVGSPQDLGGIEEIDFNLCYAAVSGTSKPVMTNWFDGANLPRSLDMLHTMAGGEAQWRARPFVTNACAFTVSPLKFAGDSCIGLEHAVRGGMPVQLICAPQMGATAPVSVVGTLVQAVAELMAGVVYSLAVSPDARIFLGFWALVTDLRTGAAATGSPEHILLAAALSRMSRFYGIPNGVPSGIADAKMHDVQAGAERGMQHGLIANAGGNILFSSSGTLASGMGVSHAGLVIDNDIAGAALRTLSGKIGRAHV